MRLTSFEVQGFKNLVAPVKLEGLGPINVLHGANNVGKSNLLHAIELFFRLVRLVRVEDWRTGQKLDEQYFAREGVPVTDAFNYAVRAPIHMSATLGIEDGELALAGIQPSLDCKQITIAMSLEPVGTGLHFRVRSFRFAGAIDIAQAQPTAEQDMFALRVAGFVATHGLGSRGVPHVPVHRQLDDAVDALYDASASEDRQRAVQWERFVETMGAFQDILDEGRFIVVLPRAASRARLLYEKRDMRVPVQALGSGVQQMAALFGHLLTCGAAIVTIEEPELNLRWSLQERVRDALRDLVGKEGAPSQIFLTSHSGAFESGERFYLMQRAPGSDAPTVERRPLSDLPLVVGPGVPEGTVSAPRAPTHVSSEGTLRLPDRIRKAVGVENGGGVCFVDKGEGVAEMMSVDTFLENAGLSDDDA